MRSVPTRTATFAWAALLVPLAAISLAACSSPRHQISTSAGAPRQTPSVTRGTGEASAAPVPVTPSGTAAGGVAVAAGPGSTAVAGGSGASGVGGSAAALAPGHTGSVTVADVRPVAVHGTATATVSCEDSGPVYVALISKAAAGGYVHSFTVRVTGYHGAGPYRGTLSATVAGSQGTVAALTGASNTDVALTRTGGTFAVDVSGSGDHTLDATVSWVCP